MKEGGYEIPDDLRYTKDHEWVKVVGPSKVIVGITDYAAKMLKEVVYVELPGPGKEVGMNGVLGQVESIKTVADIHSPLSGRVTASNSALVTNPEKVNQSPYGEGWMVEVEPGRLEEETGRLLSAPQYAELVRELAKKEEK